MTLDGLAAKMAALSASIPVRGNEAKKQIASAILNNLIETSPVDTSRLVSNWQAGAAVTGPIEPYYPGKLGSSRGESSATALATGLDHIGAAVPGVPLLVYNSTPYAMYLNNGSENRPAHAFVERALLVGRETLRAIAAGALKLG